jgi:uncharacterized caspase-like protein
MNLFQRAWLLFSFAFVLSFALALGCTPALAETRVALVIGNGAYVHAPNLPNPAHDAEDVVAALKRSHFEVISGTDVNESDMQDLAIRFSRAARTADVALFYYSGHAMQFNGVNYLMPVDAELKDEADLKRFTRVDDVLNDLQQAKNLRILVLDSCRDNPLAESLKRSIGQGRGATIRQGLIKMEAPLGTIISFSTQAGQTANDGDGRNSPYTGSFLKRIEEPKEIGEIFREVSTDVYAASGKQQLPELSLSIVGNFYLNGNVNVTVTPSQPPADPCASAETHWKAAVSVGTVAAYEDHVARFPGCAFSDLAKAKIEELKKTAAVAPAPAPMPRAQEAAATKGFDGIWDATISCANEGKVLGYTRLVTGTVQNGKLHAEALREGVPNWLSIDGQIGADGRSTLIVHGLTNDPKYVVGQLKPGSPYVYSVNAQFSGSTGSGKRVELRPCTVNFVKR